MPPYRLSIPEKLILSIVLLVLITGFTLFYTDRASFEWFVKEDNLVEWLTVAGLLMASVVCFIRFITLFKIKNWWFLTVTLVLGLFLFVAAGEEISWGQRILGIESSEYFQKNNAQGETNLHNLVVNGVKINKLVFTTVLGLALILYLVLMPVLYYKNTAFKTFIDNSGVAVPRLYQIIGFVIVAGITVLLPHEKNPELLECGASLIFFLIILYPKNKLIF
jgi:hypothetical protein